MTPPRRKKEIFYLIAAIIVIIFTGIAANLLYDYSYNPTEPPKTQPKEQYAEECYHLSQATIYQPKPPHFILNPTVFKELNKRRLERIENIEKELNTRRLERIENNGIEVKNKELYKFITQEETPIYISPAINYLEFKNVNLKSYPKNFEDLKNLKVLIFYSSNLRNFNEIKLPENLKVLEIINSVFSFELPQLKHLKNLEVFVERRTFPVQEYLSILPLTLKKLSIRSRLRKKFKNFSEFKDLELFEHYCIGDERLILPEKLKILKLRVRGSIFPVLKGPLNLRVLEFLEGSDFSAFNFDFIPENLSALIIAGSNLQGLDLSLKRIVELTFIDQVIDNSKIKIPSKLRELNLISCKIENLFLLPISIEVLNLKDCSGINFLKFIPEILLELDLRNSKPIIYKHLDKFENLDTLKLDAGGCQLRQADIKKISKKVRKLVISSITDGCFDLSHLKACRVLILENYNSALLHKMIFPEALNYLSLENARFEKISRNLEFLNVRVLNLVGISSAALKLSRFSSTVETIIVEPYHSKELYFPDLNDKLVYEYKYREYL